MVASQAVMEKRQHDAVLEISATMEAHAASGDWDKVEELAGRLRNAVMAVPEAERRAALLSAHRTIEQIQGLARSARGDVTEKLSAIRRGKDATKAYAGTE